MANYITTATTDPNQTNIRMTTNLMILLKSYTLRVMEYLQVILLHIILQT